jgi:hypothetical protein
MAHFAKLDNDNKVLEVNVVNNAAIDSNNEEESGIEFLTNWSGGYSNWKQTSYNATTRGNFAGKGMIYLPLEDIFIWPKCHTEAILNAAAAKWDCTNEDHDIKEMPLA